MMTEQTGPPESQRPTMSPLVGWMSRHGWKLLAALVAIELLFHAFVMGAQDSAVSVGGRSATVRVNVSTTVPRVAFVRQIVPLTVVARADGTQEVSFRVVVTSNSQWQLRVRPRFLRRSRSIPPIEVQSADGIWVRLDQAPNGVVVVPKRAPCTDEGYPVMLRLQSGDHITALGRVQFDVTPIPE